MSLRMYQRTQTNTESPRQREYRLFAIVTGKMLAVVRNGPGPANSELIAAIDHNRRLWNALQTDCADDNNQLGTPERAGIISLAIWVEKYSRQVVKGEGKLDLLVDVNRIVMEGLAA